MRSIIRRVRSWLPWGPGSSPTSVETSEQPPVTAEHVRSLVEVGRLDDALHLVRQHLEERYEDVAFLRATRDVARRTGELTLQRRVTARELQVAPSGAARTAARFQLGRWRETSTDWWPEVDGGPASARRAGRVVHVLKQSLPYRQSGYTVRSRYVMRGQRDVGLDPVAVTALDFPGPDVPAEDVVDGIRHHRLLRPASGARHASDRYLQDWADALVPVVAREEPELLHVHSGHRGYDAAKVGLAVGRALDLPVVYEVRGFFESLWSDDLERNERGELYERRRAVEAECMRQADAVVTLSESMRQDIVARGVDPASVVVIPNGVDPMVFAPRRSATDLRAGLQLSGFVFGYVSNLDHYREGQETLVDAAAHLRRSGVDATALVVGDGTRRAELEEYARRQGAADAVVFTGAVPHAEVLDYYAVLDAFVVPRIDERAARLVTPLKPYEAMAMGVPLVVSDLPALQEVIGGGERGRSFGVSDAVDLARVLTSIAVDPAAAADTAMSARDWVLRERSWQGHGEQYRALYDRVLHTRRSAGRHTPHR